LAKLKTKLGRRENGLWNATLPVEFTCTIGLVITNHIVIGGVVVVAPPVAGGVVVDAIFCESVRLPVQSAFTMYVPVYWNAASGVF
jgi:hypothetical protein